MTRTRLGIEGQSLSKSKCLLGSIYFVINSCALSTSVDRGTVFSKTRLIPDLDASVCDRLCPYNVKRIIGICGSNFRSSGADCNPFITGMERSKTITSGLLCFAAPIASWPFSASTHVLKPSDRRLQPSSLSRRYHPPPKRSCRCPAFWGLSHVPSTPLFFWG